MTTFPNRGFYRGDLMAFVRDTNRAAVALLPFQHELLAQPEGTSERSAILAEEITPHLDPATFTPGPTKISRTQALQSGYTGNQCDNCNSMQMKISGHCEVCVACGTTTGCS